MKVLLFGATGHLGGHLADRLPLSAALAIAPRVAVEDERAPARAIDEARPDVVVNAIGVRPKAARELLRAVNAEFPQRLAARAAARGARVVQISTDAVFSGARGHYSETDTPDPIDDYGESKLAGELAPPHLTIRSTFFGRNARGAGLVEWLAAQRGPVPGFEDYRFSGISAALLADFVADAIRAGLEGTWHVGGDGVSKYDVLVAVARRLQLAVDVVPVRHGAIDRTLDSSRFFRAIGRMRPTLAESISTLEESRQCR
jgi:dTDP-4-dehydrorhamnose reductase